MLGDVVCYCVGAVLTGAGYYLLGRLGRRAWDRWDRSVKERRL